MQDPERRMGPFAYKGDQWVSFDDAEQVKLKAEFIKKMGLAGGMVWALDLDDFKNYCQCEPHPLLRTLNRVLRNYPDGPVCQITRKSEFIQRFSLFVNFVWRIYGIEVFPLQLSGRLKLERVEVSPFFRFYS